MDVVIKVATATKKFSVGTKDEAFKFEIDSNDAGGLHVEGQSEDTEYTFKDIPAGKYTATVSKLGVESSAAFEVEDDTPPMEGIEVEVPQSVTVEVAPPSKAKASKK